MNAKKLAIAAALVVAAGCHGAQQRESEYGFPADAQGGVAMREKSFSDRHPLFAAPRHYYQDSGDNPIVKVGAATFVGVPVGIAKEVWQIGYGQ